MAPAGVADDPTKTASGVANSVPQAGPLTNQADGATDSANNDVVGGRKKKKNADGDEQESSLKIKIDLDLDVEVHLTARVKGHIVIGLL